jgi:hypothetical protein
LRRPGRLIVLPPARYPFRVAGDRWNDVKQFAAAIYRHTTFVVGSGLFATAAFVWGLLEWASPNLTKLPTPYWWLLWGITGGLLFTAAFLAWRDEFYKHAALRTESERMRPRIIPSHMEKIDDHFWTFLFIVNDSDEPALDVMMQPVIVGESFLEFDGELARVSRSDGEVRLKLGLWGNRVGTDERLPRTRLHAADFHDIMVHAGKQSEEFAFYYKDFSARWYKSVCLLRAVDSPMRLHVSFIRQEQAADPRQVVSHT